MEVVVPEPVSRRSVLLGGTLVGAAALSALNPLPVAALPGAVADIG